MMTLINKLLDKISRFNVGDRVYMKDENDLYKNISDTGTVASVEDGGYEIVPDNYISSLYFYDYEVSHVRRHRNGVL